MAARPEMSLRASGLARRRLLAALPAAALLRPARAETALVAPGIGATPTLAVAGTEDSDAADIGRLLRPVLSGALAGGPGLTLRFLGGRDGVVGSNQFDARAMPDGENALLFPGAAAMAQLAGDPRAHFEPGHWIPLLAVGGSGLLLMRRPGWITGNGPVRLACQGGSDPAAAALLGLDLLGILAVATVPTADPLVAAARDEIDAVYLTGPDVGRRLGPFASAGLLPFFSAGDLLSTDVARRDPLLPDVPSFGERLGTSSHAYGKLQRAWRAATAAGIASAALVLPMLSPQSAVLKWRRACQDVADTPDVAAELSRRGHWLAREDQASHLLAMAAPEAAVAGQFRAWLGARMGWHP